MKLLREWLDDVVSDLMITATVLVLGALVLCTHGCASSGLGTPDPRTGQEQAVWIVWHYYGREDVPPKVRWVRGAALSCTTKDGKAGFPLAPEDVADDGRCRLGLAWSSLEVLVADHGEAISETSLAEELEHAELLRRGIYETSDESHHARPDFDVRRDRANELLRKAGL